MRKRTQLITCKECESREELLDFLWELEQKYNLKQVVISIIKTAAWTYEVFYQDYEKETKEDRLL